MKASSSLESRPLTGSASPARRRDRRHGSSRAVLREAEALAVEGVGRVLVLARVDREARRGVVEVAGEDLVDLEGDLAEAPSSRPSGSRAACRSACPAARCACRPPGGRSGCGRTCPCRCRRAVARSISGSCARRLAGTDQVPKVAPFSTTGSVSCLAVTVRSGTPPGTRRGRAMATRTGARGEDEHPVHRATGNAPAAELAVSPRLGGGS